MSSRHPLELHLLFLIACLGILFGILSRDWSLAVVGVPIAVTVLAFYFNLQDSQWVLCSLLLLFALGRIVGMAFSKFSSIHLVHALFFAWLSYRIYRMPSKSLPPSRLILILMSGLIAIGTISLALVMTHAAEAVRSHSDQSKLFIFHVFCVVVLVNAFAFLISLIAVLKKAHLFHALINCAASFSPILIFMVTRFLLRAA
jgi:hypothetical protein